MTSLARQCQNKTLKPRVWSNAQLGTINTKAICSSVQDDVKCYSFLSDRSLAHARLYVSVPSYSVFLSKQQANQQTKILSARPKNMSSLEERDAEQGSAVIAKSVSSAFNTH